MRIAAGIVLIIAAVINLGASFVYLAGGAVMGGAGKLEAMAAEQSKKQGRELTEDEKKSFAQLEQAKDKLGVSAGALLGFSVFLFVTCGTSIAGAICLFRSKAANFVLVAGVLAVLAEVVGSIVIKFGVGNVLGLAGGLLAIIASRQMVKSAAAAAPPPMAAPM